MLGGLAGGDFGSLLQPFENAFLGPLSQLGQALMPPVGQFPKLPLPFPAPPNADNPLGPFQASQGQGNAFSTEDIANIGGTVDAMQSHAMSVLKNPNATQQDIILAQQELQKANLLFSTLSDILKQINQNAQKAIGNAIQ
jgi:hypothetical protein